VHLEGTNRPVDVIREGFDLAIRVRFPPLADSDLIIRQFGRSAQRLVASPTLLDGCSTRPMVPADLAAMPSLAWGPSRSGYEWCIDGPDGAIATIPYQPRLVTEDMAALRFSALAGIGVCPLPTIVVRHDLEAGRLVDILPEWAPRAGIVHAAFPSRRGLLPSVRMLIDFLAAEYAALEASTPEKA
jgi:DNA-binding transcriptional LysR family regulator